MYFGWRNGILTVCATAALFTLVGCSVDGKWSVARIDPDAARRDFEFSSLTLQDDETFYAEANGTDGIKSVSGTYTYDDGVLSLKTHDGQRYTYDAKLCAAGHEMKLARHWEGRRLEATLERE